MPTSIGDVMSALEQLLLEHFKSINHNQLFCLQLLTEGSKQCFSPQSL